MHIQSILAIIALLLATGACGSKATPQPIFSKHIPGVSTSNLNMQPHSLSYRKMGNSMEYEVKLDTVGDQELWQIGIKFNGSSEPDRIWLDTTSFAFRRRLLILKDYTIDVSMADRHFGGELVPAAGSDYEAVTYDKTYEHDAFEPAIINYAIASLPLANDYTASIPVFDLNKGSSLLWSNIRVVGEEVLTIDGKQFDCWKVVSQGIRDKTIWISKQHSYAVKMTTKGNAGSWELEPESIKLY